MYSPGSILTKNKKTGVSIDLPRTNCRPTKRCKFDCYARLGNQSRSVCLRKQRWVDQYLQSGDLSRLIKECRPHIAIRLNGSGDFRKEHIPNLLKLAEACPRNQFYGMTRKIELAKALNNKLPNLRVMVSIDATSPKSIWKYDGALCYGPRHPEDKVPDDPRILIVFPRHHTGKVIKGMPHHPKDCQGVWHTISGCMVCGRCWEWDYPSLENKTVWGMQNFVIQLRKDNYSKKT